MDTARIPSCTGEWPRVLSWSPGDERAAAVFVLGRLWVFVVALASIPAAAWADDQGWAMLVHVLTQRWDAEHFSTLALHGYPAQAPGPDPATHVWAFAPLYPAVTGLLHAWTGMPLEAAQLGLNALLGPCVAVLLRRWLAMRVAAPHALWGVAFFSFWPQNYFLTMAYAEPLHLVLLLLALGHAEGRPPSVRGGFMVMVSAATATLARMVGFLDGVAMLPARMLDAVARERRLPALVRGREPLAMAAITLGGLLAYAWHTRAWCYIRTGESIDCYGQAMLHGWGGWRSQMPWNFLDDAAEILRTPGPTLWHMVRAWDLLAYVLTVAAFVLLLLRVKRWGWVPAALMSVPVAAQLTTLHVRTSPRYLGGTVSLYLLLALLAPRPRLAAVLLGLMVLLGAVSEYATLNGVWQSF